MIIFSLDKQDKPASDSDRQNVINLMDAKSVLGVYNDELEVSFIVHDGFEDLVKQMCAFYNQDCYLKVNESGAYLVYSDRSERIGDKLVKLDKKPDSGAYTIIDNYFWVVA